MEEQENTEETQENQTPETQNPTEGVNENGRPRQVLRRTTRTSRFRG